MNKKQLVAYVAEILGDGTVTPAVRRQADAAVNAVLSAVTGAMMAGDPVKLVEFGTFELRYKPERTRRVPSTGQPVVAPESWKVVFRPSQVLQARVTQNAATWPDERAQRLRGRRASSAGQAA